MITFFSFYFHFFRQEALHLKRNQANPPAIIIKTFKLFSCEVETVFVSLVSFVTPAPLSPVSLSLVSVVLLFSLVLLLTTCFPLFHF